MVSLGQRIRELRLKKGLTQIELAHEICTPSMVSQIESDRARPSYKMMTALANRLDITVDRLLTDVDFNMECASKYRMALAMVQAGEYVPAIPFFEELLKVENSQISQSDLLHELGTCYLQVGKDEQAITTFSRVLEINSMRQDHHLMAAALLNLGVVATRNREYQLAFYHIQRGLDELSKVEVSDTRLQAKLHFQLATLYQEIGKVEESVKAYKEALELYEGFGDLEEISKTFLRLSKAYQKRKNFAKASEYATMALSVLEALNNMAAYQDVQRQILLLEHNDDNWEKAINDLLEFTTAYEELGDAERAGDTLADVAAIYLERNRLDLAEEFSKRVILMLPFDHQAVGKAHRVLAFVCFRQGESEKGRQHLDNAMVIFENLGLVAELEEVTLHMCHFLDSRGQHEEAFKRLEKHYDILVKTLEVRGIEL